MDEDERAVSEEGEVQDDVLVDQAAKCTAGVTKGGGGGGGAQLRLVKISSDILPEEQRIAIIDARTHSPDGVSIGRDRVHTPRVRLPSMLVSKHHANIFPLSKHSPGRYTFAVVDTGSTHGTFYANKASFKNRDAPNLRLSLTEEDRISAPKQASKPITLHHLGLLCIGETLFEIHHHSAKGSSACSECVLTEDGANEVPLHASAKPKDLVDAAVEAKNEKQGTHLTEKMDSESVRRAQLSNLRAQYVGLNRNTSSRSPKYLDRAASRREKTGWPSNGGIVPPQPKASFSSSPSPLQKNAPRSAAPPLDESNRGYKLFAAMSASSSSATADNANASFAHFGVRGVEGRAGLGSKPLLDVEQIAKRGADQAAMNSAAYTGDAIRERQRRRYEEADGRQ